MTSDIELSIENDSIKEERENKINKQVATLCILYLLLTLAFVCWQMFDIWIGQHSLARLVRYDLEPLDTPAFRLIFFTVMAGGLGGIINGMRSALEWFPKFDRKYAWKYIMAPWLGAALALLVYALLNSGVAVFGGGGISDVNTTRILAMFSTGALAGYGARDVFIWLDAQVSRLFNPEETGARITDGTEEAVEGATTDDLGEVDTVANVETTILALGEESMETAATISSEPSHLVNASGSEKPVAL